MIRRIVLTMLLLVSVLLVTAVAPLGLLMAGREQDSFRMETVLSAQTLASAAEKGLVDHSPGRVLAASFVQHARAQRRGLGLPRGRRHDRRALRGRDTGEHPRSAGRDLPAFCATPAR